MVGVDLWRVAMKRTKKMAVSIATAAAVGVATALTMTASPATAATPLVVGGTVACPLGTGFAKLSITTSTGETESTTTLDHVFHYSLTFSTVSAIFLFPQKAVAHANCYGPLGNIAVSYDDNIVKLAHPLIGTGWTANISPS
jgi:hypothetical protein